MGATVAERTRTIPTRDDVEHLLAQEAVVAVFQPIVSMHDGGIVGYEALARMHALPQAPPDVWIEAAELAEQRVELELLCVKAALASGLPPGDARLFVNVSAEVLADPRMLDIVPFEMVPRLVFELTETEVIVDYEAARRSMRNWTSLGAHLAIDDTGSGYASLRHVLQLGPDVIKLDQSLIDGIETDRSRRALATALATFARELGAEVVAEGVEHPDQLRVLEEAGVGLVQGYLLGRPAPPWPTAANPARLVAPVGEDLISRHRSALESAVDPVAACRATCEFLAHLHGVMPSVYLLHGDRLRCQAQTGLWQVLDGLVPGVGITGQCFAEERELVIHDVHRAPRYLEAIPGVHSEACVPIRVEGMVVGALNIDVRRALTHDDLDILRVAATMLGERLADVGRSPAATPFDRVGLHMRRLGTHATVSTVIDGLITAALDISGLDSAMHASLPVDRATGDLRVDHAVGPLRHSLTTAAIAQGAALQALVTGTTSCYSAGASMGQGFVGFEDLRLDGVRAIVVVPLETDRRRLGLLALAGTRPRAFTTADVEPLEVLATHASLLVERLLAAG
jgi:EAL domain-containing protein (putative c-di-GMP-specific phosphodiesterase class I)/putative methionine-R-sulfoxide reductase with GAF domain